MTQFFIEKFYLFFQGAMLFQVLFFGMVYLITKRKDVLYYSLLNFVSAGYFFLNAPDTFFGIEETIVFDSPLYRYVNFAILLSMILVYLVFLKEIFSDSLIKYPYIKKIYSITFYLIPSLYILFVLFALSGWKTNAIFYTGHIVNGPFCTFILIVNFKQKGYKSLIINGMLVLFVCVVTTMMLTIRYNSGSNDTILDRYPLAIIKLGMLIDIMLFQLALLKRWNEQERQLAIEKIQSQLEVEKLRNKISSQLHDDIGSTLSGVSMYSHLTNNQMERGEHDQAKVSLNIIQQSANAMVEKLNDLVWSVNPEHDSLPMMLERLQQYGLDMCSAKNMQFKMETTVKNSIVDLPSEQLYHLYLFIKEAINNAAKYSEANLLRLTLEEKKSLLEISIIDNGKGFDIASIKRGNGLTNMQKRADELGAVFSIQSKAGEGCLIALKVKIT